MIMLNPNKVYRIKGDEYFYDHEQCLDKLLSDFEKGERIYLEEGYQEAYKTSDFFNIDSLGDEMLNCAYDTCSEFADDFMWDFKGEKKDILEKIISNYLDANFEAPSFYNVINVKEISLILP